MGSKWFENPYKDYSLNRARDVIDNSQIKTDSEFINDVESFCNDNSNFTGVNFSDNTVYTGTAGIALYYLQKSRTDSSALNEAVKYLGLDKLRNRRITFLCGDSGSLAIGAIVYHKLGDIEKSKCLIERLLSLNTEVLDAKSDLPNEFLYGRAGYLYALLFVNKYINPPPIEEKLIKKILGIMLQMGKKGAKFHDVKVPLLYDWHNKHYLGAAHGLSGIIYLMLHASKYLSRSELNDLVRPTVDYLVLARYSSGNFKSSLGSDSDRLIQWCHGAPGFTHLFCKAYEVFQDEKYLNLALECGEVVWEKGLLRKGYSICHGISGNAYTFLELFQTTKDDKHLYRAIKFAEWCMESNAAHEEHRPDNPISLFEGIIGRLYFLQDMKNPMEAKFPAYDL